MAGQSLSFRDEAASHATICMLQGCGNEGSASRQLVAYDRERRYLVGVNLSLLACLDSSNVEQMEPSPKSLKSHD